MHAVRDHQHRVRLEQRADLGLIRLKLMVRGPDRRVLVRRVFQLQHRERQTVDEQHHVGPPLVLVLDHRELVDREPIVGGRIVEVDRARLRAADAAVGVAVLHRHALYQHPMQRAVALQEIGTRRASQLAEGVLQRLRGEPGVQPRKRIAQPRTEHHFAVIAALG
ncbi:MAG: hypothetical protein KatS3mg125_1008 [Lysobacterales bacterium]|nr:MAG: hypothetical protein KatS3mg125_1008 [Xanthomonadales bacterium]